MDFEFTELQNDIRRSVRELCAQFPLDYWRKCDEERKYPEEFVRALTEAGWLSVLIPEEYGGAGLGITEGAIVLEEINRSGGNAAVCHAQMYTMGALLRHGSPEQKQRYLPAIAKGELRLQAFGVTEPTAGTDTTKIRTFAKKVDGGYVINGEKIFISRFLHSDLMLLLARTTPLEEVDKKTRGMSIFLVDLREAGNSIRAVPLDTMINHHTTRLFIDDLFVPDDALIGEEGRGFYYILDGMNAERVLVASQSVGDGYWFIEQAVKYANERVIFDRPIGKNQGVQFPIARAYMMVEAAATMCYKAATKFDQGLPCGAEANMAKYLASEAAWEAADVCMSTYGGYAFTREYHIERKWREARLYRTAPIHNNLVLSYIGEHVLGMPRSY